MLFAIATAAAGLFFNQVRTSREEAHSSRLAMEAKEIERAEAVNKTAQLREELSTSESKRLRLTAVRDASGNPALDGHGNAIFNREEIASNWQERLTLLDSSYKSKLTEKDTTINQLSEEMATIKASMTKPSRSPWGFGLGYSAPFKTWLNYTEARYWGGVAYHVPIFGLDAGLHGMVGATIAGDTEAKLYLELRP